MTSTNEVTVVDLYGLNNGGQVIRYTCADTGDIKKGTIMTFSDPRTVASMANTEGVIFAGICNADKESGDGATSVGCWTNGIFEMKASGAITTGDIVETAAGDENTIKRMVDGASGAVMADISKIVGIALEDAATDEVINVRVNI